MSFICIGPLALDFFYTKKQIFCFFSLLIPGFLLGAAKSIKKV